MKSGLLFALAVYSFAAQGAECTDLQERQGCRTAYFEYSDTGPGYHCSYSMYGCPNCGADQGIRLKESCRSERRRRGNPHDGYEIYWEWVCTKSPVCE